MKLLVLLLILLVMLGGCIAQPTAQTIADQQEDSEQEIDQRPINLCIQDCKYWLSRNISQTSYWKQGPCLLNPILEANDWVCDIAHKPRKNVDNLPDNQCSAYRKGKAKHFVELDENCNLIRAV